MNNRNIRIGDWVCDPSNYNYEMRVGLNEIAYAHIFNPIKLSERFLGLFKREEIGGRETYFKGEETRNVALEKLVGKWRLSIHTEDKHFEGEIITVQDFQHLLSDCGIYWDIKCD